MDNFLFWMQVISLDKTLFDTQITRKLFNWNSRTMYNHSLLHYFNCFVRLPHLLYPCPEHTEHEALQPIGKQPGLQASSQESHYTLLPDHQLRRLPVPNRLMVGLPDGLYHPHWISDAVRDHARSKPNASTSQQLLPGLVKLWKLLLQKIEGEKPGEVSGSCGRGSCQGTVPENSHTLALHLCWQKLHTSCTLSLQGCLQSIYRRYNQPPGGRRCWCCSCFDRERQLRIFKIFQGKLIGSGVAKPC